METAMLQANALTTLPALKAALGMSDEDISSDSLLIQLINRASTSVERALGRKLRRHVASIKQAGEEIDPGLYDIATQGNAGVICKDDGWTYYGYPQGLTGDPVTGSRNIEVKYTAGYILPWEATEEEPSDLPADLEGLVQEMVQYAFGRLETGGSAGLKAFSISDVRWEWSEDTPSSWQEIINQYKRVWV